MKNSTLITSALFLSFFVMAFLVVPLVEAQCASSDRACGEIVTENTPGFGAVELCDNCFVCGEADGVCPSLYSDGTIVTKHMVMKVPNAPIPGYTNADAINYDVGNDACSVIGGTCTSIQQSTDGASWSSASGLNCAANISGVAPHLYIRAVCNAPKTASCDECPDPDCNTTLKGVAYDASTNQPMQNVRVRLHAPNNPANIDSSTYTSISGVYDSDEPDFLSVTGNLVVTCTHPQFLPHVENVYLQPERNIVNCRMERADCTPECTIPDRDGVYRCSEVCHGVEGCNYPTIDHGGTSYQPEDIAAMCDGVKPGTFIPIGTHPSDENRVVGVECCNSETSRFMPRFRLEGDDIRNLITRNFRKELDGVPVTLKIIVYSR